MLTTIYSVLDRSRDPQVGTQYTKDQEGSKDQGQRGKTTDQGPMTKDQDHIYIYIYTYTHMYIWMPVDIYIYMYNIYI